MIYNKNTLFTEASVFSAPGQKAFEHPVNVTGETKLAINEELTRLWGFARNVQNYNINRFISIIKTAKILFERLGNNELSSMEAKSLCDCSMHILQKYNNAKFIMNFRSLIDKELLFKTSLQGYRSYSNFDIKSFIKFFKLIIGDTHSIQKYLNLY